MNYPKERKKKGPIPEEVRKRMSEAAKAHGISKETRIKINAANKGRVRSGHSEDTKKKIGASNFRKKRTSEFIWKAANLSKGNLCSETARINISKSLKESEATSISKQGEKSHTAKLTEVQAWEIYEYACDGKLTQIKIAEMYNISSSAVNAIYKKRAWKCMHKDPIKLIHIDRLLEILNIDYFSFKKTLEMDVNFPKAKTHKNSKHPQWNEYEVIKYLKKEDN